MKKTQTIGGKDIDLVALLILTHQVRNLLRFHQCMGIKGYPGRAELADLFFGRNDAGIVSTVTGNKNQKPEKVSAKKPEPVKKSAISLSLIQEEVKRCRSCPLAENRLGQVAGKGLQGAKLMVVGDWSHQKDGFSPDIIMGREEDTMLWRMMDAIGLGREQVFITNVIKCCPVEIEADDRCIRLCSTHLALEISCVQPAVILVMGVVAAHAIVATDVPLVSLRGRFYPCRLPGCKSIRVMASFHPCFLVSNPEMKEMTWQDLQMIQRQFSFGRKKQRV